MARPRKAGKRNKAGRLVPQWDYGNDIVRAHRERLARIAGGVKPTDDLHCALGQAHAAGLLEGLRVEGRVLLEHGKEWHRLYRLTFGGTVATANLARIGRSKPSLEDTPADYRYAAWARIVDSLSRHERERLNLVCVEYGDTMHLPPFLERLINERKVAKGMDVGGYLPVRGDREHLDALKTALLAIVEGAAQHRRVA